MKLNEKIQAGRKQLALSQEGLGEILGVSRQAVSKWENGETLPDVMRLKSMAKLYGTTVDYLLSQEEEEVDPLGHYQGSPSNLEFKQGSTNNQDLSQGHSSFNYEHLSAASEQDEQKVEPSLLEDHGNMMGICIILLGLIMILSGQSLAHYFEPEIIMGEKWVPLYLNGFSEFYDSLWIFGIIFLVGGFFFLYHVSKPKPDEVPDED